MDSKVKCKISYEQCIYQIPINIKMVKPSILILYNISKLAVKTLKQTLSSKIVGKNDEHKLSLLIS